MTRYIFNREKLKTLKASNFKHGDIIICGKYEIEIVYHNSRVKYNRPSLLSTLMDINTFKYCDCTPGEGRPYYIDDFLST